MGASTHYKGSSLTQHGGQLLVGDYLMSPNRMFVGVLQRNGSFAIYWAPRGMGADWTPDDFEPGASGCLYATPPAQASDNYFMEWISDPNKSVPPVLVIRLPGEDPAWTFGIHPGDGYSANLVDSGELQLVNSTGGIGWRSWAHIEAFTLGTGTRDYWGLISTVPPYALSAKPGDLGPGIPPKPPRPQGVSARAYTGNFDYRTAPADEVWQIWNWIVDEKNTSGGIVFLNKASGLALGSDGKDKGIVRMTREVNELSTWWMGPTQDYNSHGIALAQPPNSLFLNLAGDSHRDGNAVMLWDWSKQPNMLWIFA